MTSNGRDFYSYPISLLQEMKIMHSTECKKHLLTIEFFLRTETLQMKISSLLLKNIYFNTMSLSPTTWRTRKEFLLLAPGAAFNPLFGQMKSTLV